MTTKKMNRKKNKTNEFLRIVKRVCEGALAEVVTF